MWRITVSMEERRRTKGQVGEMWYGTEDINNSEECKTLLGLNGEKIKGKLKFEEREKGREVWVQ